jgi:hypothetical protein
MSPVSPEIRRALPLVAVVAVASVAFTDRMRAAAVDDPLPAVSLDHHFRAIGKF